MTSQAPGAANRLGQMCEVRLSRGAPGVQRGSAAFKHIREIVTNTLARKGELFSKAYGVIYYLKILN